jgi:transcriptional regulator with XRE-family HTH domain
MAPENSVQARIHKVRDAFDLSREGFAAKIGVSSTAVRNWELFGDGDKKFRPDDSSLHGIVNGFPGVPFRWLRTGEEPEPDLAALAEAAKKKGEHPDRDKVLEAIRALEAEPSVIAYKALLAAVDRLAA